VWASFIFLYIDIENLKQCCVDLIFLKTYSSEILFYSSRHIEHNNKNRILNKYYMCEINCFNFFICTII
jgi:hypothetical protein